MFQTFICSEFHFGAHAQPEKHSVQRGFVNPRLGNSPPSVPFHRHQGVRFLVQALLVAPKLTFPPVKCKARWTTIKAFFVAVIKLSFPSLPSGFEQLCWKQLVSLSSKSLGGNLRHCFSFSPFSKRTQLQNWGSRVRSKFLFWPFSKCQPLRRCIYAWPTPQVLCHQECVTGLCPSPAYTVWHCSMQNLYCHGLTGGKGKKEHIGKYKTKSLDLWILHSVVHEVNIKVMQSYRKMLWQCMRLRNLLA